MTGLHQSNLHQSADVQKSDRRCCMMNVGLCVEAHDTSTINHKNNQMPSQIIFEQTLNRPSFSDIWGSYSHEIAGRVTCQTCNMAEMQFVKHAMRQQIPVCELINTHVINASLIDTAVLVQWDDGDVINAPLVIARVIDAFKIIAAVLKAVSAQWDDEDDSDVNHAPVVIAPVIKASVLVQWDEEFDPDVIYAPVVIPVINAP